jgi:hypothetical protein
MNAEKRNKNSPGLQAGVKKIMFRLWIFEKFEK